MTARFETVIFIFSYTYMSILECGGVKLPCARLAIRIRESGAAVDDLSSVKKTPLFCHYFSPKSSPFCAIFGLEGGTRSFVLALFDQLLFLFVVLSQN